MGTPVERFRDAVLRFFRPGAVYTFVGAGGKSTAMRKVAAVLAGTGLKVRLATTTRVGVEEFDGCPVRIVGDLPEARGAAEQPYPVLLLAGGLLEAQGKYAGIDPRLIDALPSRVQTVVLVEGDGSRRLPVKVPTRREPVIPASSRAVVAVMGASAFGQPVDAGHCYNHEGALRLLGRTGCFLEAEEIALLASHPDGCRKGVLPGMGFLVLVNQADLVEKQETARQALRLLGSRHGIDGALASVREGELYATTCG